MAFTKSILIWKILQTITVLVSAVILYILDVNVIL